MSVGLEHITLIFLVCLYATAEIYRVARSHRAIVTALHDTGVPLVPMLEQSVTVRLADGREIRAKMNCCTACLGNIGLGDEVRVSESRDGWCVHLPWFNRRSCRQ